MKNYTLLLFLFCCSVFLNACSDDDDAPSREDTLKNKRWQITALRASTPLGEFDIYNSFGSCEKDNFVEFRDNGVLVIDEGATKCSSSAPNQAQGTWSLNGDILKLMGAGASFGLPVNDLDITIVDLSSTRLNGTFNENISGFTADGTVTLEVR